MNGLKFLVLMVAVGLLSGCAMVTPQRTTGPSKVATQGWAEYTQSRAAFDEVEPFLTTVEQLQALGFDPLGEQGVLHLKVHEIEPLLREGWEVAGGLPQGVQECQAAGEGCYAYLLQAQVRKQDLGVAEDAPFRALFLVKRVPAVKEDLVVYKMWDTKPHAQLLRGRTLDGWKKLMQLARM
ncbi:hypothetical protein Mmc1_0292 [Magnetococcus marinus MC-1]|uniref:Lipoprotein n=1 Tax=Magnetococcus marinus (strain ATCC BAA-1437 / JCM 17883 / MC-1) TaxID=156889 RepID=A0L4C6_MAGMM|nr:hypothetical protein [Magnetococcus marinus]ABK42819.1 hypothetical protein Mmc1_0292 [Magnetococcus marinus MC-1]